MDAQTAALQAWSLREAQAAARYTGNAQAAAWSLWAGFGGWYDAQQVAALATRTTVISEQARAATGNLGIAYAREVIAGLRATRVLPAKLDLPAARLGADLVQVYSRPAQAYITTFSTTGDTDQALEAAHIRLDHLVADDTLIARRDGEHQQMAAAGVERYRRVVHPERSKGGVCGLCLAAADRIYSIRELMPVHDGCQCTAAEVTDAYDPDVANQIDLKALYAAAGGTTDGRELKKVRFQVNEHGELGPVLTRSGDRFQRQGDAPKGDPIERATRELRALEPVLAQLLRRDAAGEDVASALAYQVNRIAKLRAIAGLTH